MNKSAPYIHITSHRLRITYILLAIITTAIGLATRKMPQLFPGFIAEYGGDTLWALLFFLLFRIIWIKKPIWLIAIITYIFSVLIECSQLYQGEWIMRLRETFPGKMLLGHGFLWSDLLCYAVGVLIGCAIAYLLEKNKSKQVADIYKY